MDKAEYSEIASKFSSLYENKSWKEKESLSGPGSDPQNTVIYQQVLVHILDQLNTVNILDLGCGDWVSTSRMNLERYNYLGIDVVDSVIDNNILRYRKSNINFRLANFLEDINECYDLIICKDVLQHLPNKLILAYFEKFLRISKYFLLTNDVAFLVCSNGRYIHPTNLNDIPIGDHRAFDPEIVFSHIATPIFTFHYHIYHHDVLERISN